MVGTSPVKDGTVSFNVGGRIFQVRRSLLNGFPSTILVRSASEEWKPESDTPIFLDRDADQFRYVLDYMRNTKVALPLTESKAALVKDLEYYGFENVDPATISIDYSATEAADSLSDLSEKVEAEIKTQKLKKQSKGLFTCSWRVYASASISRITIGKASRSASTYQRNARSSASCGHLVQLRSI